MFDRKCTDTTFKVVLSLINYTVNHKKRQCEMIKKEYCAVHNIPNVFLSEFLKADHQVGFKTNKYTTSVIKAKNETIR